MKLNLKLGESGPEATSAPVGMKAREEYFPEFTFREDSEARFPDEGTMVIKYRKVRSSVDKKSDKPYSCTIEIREIVSANGKKEEPDETPTKKYDEAGDALDKLASEKSSSRKNSY